MITPKQRCERSREPLVLYFMNNAPESKANTHAILFVCIAYALFLCVAVRFMLIARPAIISSTHAQFKWEKNPCMNVPCALQCVNTDTYYTSVLYAHDKRYSAPWHHPPSSTFTSQKHKPWCVRHIVSRAPDRRSRPSWEQALVLQNMAWHIFTMIKSKVMLRWTRNYLHDTRDFICKWLLCDAMRQQQQQPLPPNGDESDARHWTPLHVCVVNSNRGDIGCLCEATRRMCVHGSKAAPPPRRGKHIKITAQTPIVLYIRKRTWNTHARMHT